jgi:peptide/nickel transport system permease protein
MAGLTENSSITLIEPMPLSERLGVGFWLSVGWVLIVLGCALCADVLPLPGLDHMDWENPVAPLGTSTTVSKQTGEIGASSMLYLFGTDTLGRDILTRLVYGARVSLAVGLLTPLMGLFIGGILGLLAGFYKGRLEVFIMSVMDVILAFPGLVLLLLVVFHLGPNLHNLVMALGFLTIPAFTRVARANTLKFAEQDFVTAARALGKKDVHILMGEILPNITMPLLVYGLLVVSYMIVAEGALSFLGLGVPAPTPSWGSMIAEGKEVLDEAAHVSLIPALIMFLTILSFNIIGDAVRGLVDAREGQL